jgi:hypothetical protein
VWVSKRYGVLADAAARFSRLCRNRAADILLIPKRKRLRSVKLNNIAIISNVVFENLTIGEVLLVEHVRGFLRPPTCNELADYAKMNRRTAWRALQDLQRMGILKFTQRPIRTGDGPRSLAAVKEVSEDVFALLGLTKDLEEAREDKRNKPPRPPTTVEEATMRLQVAAMKLNFCPRGRQTDLGSYLRGKAPPKPA